MMLEQRDQLPAIPLTVRQTNKGHELVLDDPVAGVVRIATVDRRGDIACEQAIANCLAAAFLMLHALDGLIDGEPVDGYIESLDAEQANLWRAALRAHSLAQGDFAGAAALVDEPF